MLLETDRLTEESPASAPKAPLDEERLKFGCCGLLTEFNSDARVF